VVNGLLPTKNPQHHCRGHARGCEMRRSGFAATLGRRHAQTSILAGILLSQGILSLNLRRVAS
jgi:hypothetical protein